MILLRKWQQQAWEAFVKNNYTGILDYATLLPNHSGYKEIVNKNYPGFITTTNAEEMLEKCIVDADFRKTLVDEAKLYVQMHHSLKTAKKLYELIKMTKILALDPSLNETGCRTKVSGQYSNGAFKQYIKYHLRGKGKSPSEETKKKMSISQKGHKRSGWKLSSEVRKKMSNSKKGEKHFFYGKHHSKETKQKISNSLKGRHPSEETLRKRSISLKGKKRTSETKRKMSIAIKSSIKFQTNIRSKETRKKMSDSRKGVSPWNKGKTNVYTAEQLNNMSLALKKKFKDNPDLVKKCCGNFNRGSKVQHEFFLRIKTNILFHDAKENIVIGRKFVDIVIERLKLIIEYDGSKWHKEKNLDRDKYLLDKKYSIIHVIDGCITPIILEKIYNDYIINRHNILLYVRNNNTSIVIENVSEFQKKLIV